MPITDVISTTPVVEQYEQGGNYCNGTPFQDGPFNFPTSVQTERVMKSWSRTPNYRDLVRAKAQLPDNPFEFLHWSQTSDLIPYPVRGTNTCASAWDVRNYYTQWTITSGRVGANPGERRLSEHAVIAKLLQRMRGAEFQAPVFIVEARQTANMVLGAARDLASAYRSLRRGDLRSAVRTLGLGEPNVRESRTFNRDFGRDARRTAANRWLELQYGWTPLLHDAKNAAEVLAETVTNAQAQVGRVSAIERLASFRSEQIQIEVSPAGFCQRTSNQQESVKGVWRFKPAHGHVIASLGLLNPALVAWELVPLSFVVDWFLPIGRYLEQLDTPYRAIHLGGTMGYRRSVQSFESGFTRGGAAGSGSHSSRYTLVQRVPLTSAPALGLDSLWLDPNIGARRVLSGLALASQAFRR